MNITPTRIHAVLCNACAFRPNLHDPIPTFRAAADHENWNPGHHVTIWDGPTSQMRREEWKRASLRAAHTFDTTKFRAVLQELADAAGRLLYDGSEASPEVRTEMRTRLSEAEMAARPVLEALR